MHKLPNAAVPCAERCHASIQRQTRARCKARHSPSRPRETEARRKVSRATPHGTVAGTGSRRAATIAHRTSSLTVVSPGRRARPCAVRWPAVALTSTSHQGAPAGGYSDSNSEVKRKIAALKHSLQARPPPECTSNRQQQTAAGESHAAGKRGGAPTDAILAAACPRKGSGSGTAVECVHCCAFGVFHVVICIMAGGRVGRVAGITARALGRAPVHRRAPCAAQPDARRPRGVAVRSRPPARQLSSPPPSWSHLAWSHLARSHLVAPRPPALRSAVYLLRAFCSCVCLCSCTAARSTLAPKEARGGRTCGVPDVYEKWVVRRTGFRVAFAVCRRRSPTTPLYSSGPTQRAAVPVSSRAATSPAAGPLQTAEPHTRGAVRTDVDGWLAAMPHPHAHLATREHSRRCLGYYYLSAGAARSSNGERSVATDVVAVRAETGAFEERMEQIRARLRSEGRDFEAKLNQVRRTCGFST